VTDGDGHSFEFVCNEHKDGVQQIWYPDNECAEDEHTMIESVSADKMHTIEYVDTEVYDLLILQIYHNDECVMDEANWSHDALIVNVCSSMNNGLSRLVTCDVGTGQVSSFTVQTYEDSECRELVDERTLFSGDCDANGAKTMIVQCGHTQAPTLTPTVLPTALPTVKPSSTSTTTILPSIRVSTTSQTRENTEPEDNQQNATQHPSSSPLILSSTSPSSVGAAAVLNDNTTECINFFGGRDVKGTNCFVIEALVWLIIGVLLVTIMCCCLYFCCNESARRWLKYGRATKDTDDELTTETSTLTDDIGYHTDDDDFSDHPRAFIDVNGVERTTSIKSVQQQQRRRGNVASFSMQSGSDTDGTVVDLHPHAINIRHPQQHSQLYLSSSSGRYSSITQAVSSLEAGAVIPHRKHEDVKEEEEVDEYGNVAGNVVGNVMAHIDVNHDGNAVNEAQPPSTVIEIDNVVIDVLQGVNMSAVHSMSNSVGPLQANHDAPLQSVQSELSDSAALLTNTQNVHAHARVQPNLNIRTLHDDDGDDDEVDVGIIDDNDTVQRQEQHLRVHSMGSRSRSSHDHDFENDENESQVHDRAMTRSGTVTSALNHSVRSVTDYHSTRQQQQQRLQDSHIYMEEHELDLSSDRGSQQIFHRQRIVNDIDLIDHYENENEKASFLPDRKGGLISPPVNTSLVVQSRSARAKERTHTDTKTVTGNHAGAVHHIVWGTPNQSVHDPMYDQNSMHGALSSALACSVVDDDENKEEQDEDKKEEDRQSSNRSDFRRSPNRNHQHRNVHHCANNSLFDPLCVGTPPSHGALSSALEHSIRDSDDDNDDGRKQSHIHSSLYHEDQDDFGEDSIGSMVTGTVTSALAHSVHTRMNENEHEHTLHHAKEISQSFSSHGTIHDL